jgi:hypothetical protein
MAEHLPAGPAELGAPMDYPAHEHTYEGFISLAKVSTVATINVLLALVLFAYAGTGGFWLGTLMLILLMVAAAVGVAMRGSLKPSVVVLVIGLILVILSVA